MTLQFFLLSMCSDDSFNKRRKKNGLNYFFFFFFSTKTFIFILCLTFLLPFKLFFHQKHFLIFRRKKILYATELKNIILLTTKPTPTLKHTPTLTSTHTHPYTHSLMHLLFALHIVSHFVLVITHGMHAHSYTHLLVNTQVFSIYVHVNATTL